MKFVFENWRFALIEKTTYVALVERFNHSSKGQSIYYFQVILMWLSCVDSVVICCVLDKLYNWH